MLARLADRPEARHPAIPRESFRLDGDESHRRGRRFEVYRVISASTPGKQYSAVYNGNNATWYCDCPAGQHDRLCKHIVGVAYWVRWLVAWRGYLHLTRQELEERAGDFRRIARGVLGGYRHWEIDRDACLSVLHERNGEAA